MASRDRVAVWGRPARREFLRAIASVTVCAFGPGLTASCAAPSPESRTTRMYRIGYLAPRLVECEDPSAWQSGDGFAIKAGETPRPDSSCQAARMVSELEGKGYRQDENLEFIVAGPPEFGQGADVASFVRPAAELVARRVDLIVTVGAYAPVAARRMTTTIPIIAYRIGNFVENGIVSNLARPGGNVTGVSLQDATGKQLEVLTDAFPWVARPMVIHLGGASALNQVDRTVGLARAMGLAATPILWTPEGSDFAAKARQAIDEGADSMVLLLGTARPAVVLSLIREHRLPAIGGGLAFAESGQVLGLGTAGQIDPMTADYIDRVLKGANPGELPVVTTTAYVIYVNLKLAEEFGIVIASSVLAQATAVIK